MIRSLRFTILTILPFLAWGCLEDSCTEEIIYVRFDPEFLPLTKFRAEPQMEGTRALENPGKLYIYGDYIFVNEQKKGVHIIDNRDAENPQNIAFIPIPGNVDVAVRNNILYADSYSDLLSFDISQPDQPKFLSRAEDVFPNYGFDPERGLITGYVASNVSETYDCDQAPDQWWWDDLILWAEDSFDGAIPTRGGANVPIGGSGQGGSLARFTIIDQWLYSVDEYTLHIFDISIDGKPDKVNQMGIGWQIETIFPFRDYLFFGGRQGMYIYDQTNQPEHPTFLAEWSHANACDPVFVEGNTAYITLRDGTECETFTNQLEVVDISNIEQPVLLATYPMHNPMGLSIADELLFICENDQGLKVFKASNWQSIDQNLLTHRKGFTAYDVITFEKERRALVIGGDGLYQFTYALDGTLNLLSVVPVE